MRILDEKEQFLNKDQITNKKDYK